MRIIRQTFVILKQNPLLSTISILGTAFAITMIMAIVITWQTKYADLEPEVNRSRCLYFSAMHVYDKEKDGNNNWSNPSAAFMKECVQPVPEVEYCTAFSPAGLSLASLTDGNNRVKVDAMRTDPDFWKVFSMQFLAGRGFSEADRAGESKAVVVCASVARKLYGSTDVVGQEFLLNREFARIVGVVKDVSVFEVKGVGEVNVSDLTCDELKVALRGVGSADIHVVCDYLTARMSGVGDVTLSGTAGHADISKGGIGGVNTCNLKVGR